MMYGFSFSVLSVLVKHACICNAHGWNTQAHTYTLSRALTSWLVDCMNESPEIAPSVLQ